MKPTDNRLKCSFCGKSQDHVKKLIAGPGVYVCDECVDLCNEILDDEFGFKPDEFSKVFKLEGVMPKPHAKELPRPLKQVSESTIATSIASLESLIEAYDTARKTDEAGPFCRALLVLQEHECGPTSVKLLPIIEKLYGIYYSNNQYQSAAHVLNWAVSIADEQEEKHADRPRYLMNLAKIYIKLGQQSRRNLPSIAFQSFLK